MAVDVRAAVKLAEDIVGWRRDAYLESEVQQAEAILMLNGALRDLVKSVEAQRQLDAGFKGMGYNIVQETASRIHLHLRQAKKLLGEQ